MRAAGKAFVPHKEDARVRLTSRKIGCVRSVRTVFVLFCWLIGAGCSSLAQAAQSSTPSPTLTLTLPVPEAVFASSQTIPLLQYPEGITSWRGDLYTAMYNVATPSDSRILVFNTASNLIATLGGKPGQELISEGPLLGLTIDPRTGYLYCAANGIGKIFLMKQPTSSTPQISVYATYPKGGGPKDLVLFLVGTGGAGRNGNY